MMKRTITRLCLQLLAFGALPTMALAQQPNNDNCAGAFPLTPSIVCTPTAASSTNATASLPPQSVCSSSSESDDDVWFSFVPTTSGQQITVVGSSSFDAVVEVFSGACGSAALTCKDATGNGGTEFIKRTDWVVGQTYYFRVYHYSTGSGSGNFTVCVTELPPPSKIVSTPNGGNWSSTNTWLGGVLPTEQDSVLIADGSKVLIDVDATVANLEIGTNAADTRSVLRFSGTLSRTLTVTGNLVVNNMDTLLAYGNGTSTRNVYVGKNLTNNGYANFTRGSTNLYFNGTQTQMLDGTGTYEGVNGVAVFRQIVVNNTGANGVFLITRPIAATIGFTLSAGNVMTYDNLTLDNTITIAGVTSPNTVTLRRMHGAFVGNINVPAAATYNVNYSAITSTVTEPNITAGSELINGYINALTIERPSSTVSLPASLHLKSTSPLTLSSGYLKVENADDTLKLLSNTATLPSGSSSSYIEGAISLVVNTSSVTRTFPLGSGGQYRPVVFNSISGTNDVYYAQILTTAPTGAVITPLTSVLGARVYKLGSTATLAATATVTFSYGADDNMTGGVGNIRVAQASTASGAWAEVSASSSAGSLTSGTRTTNAGFAVANNPFFAFATTVAANDLGATVLVSPKNIGCGGTNVPVIVTIKNFGSATRTFANDTVGIFVTNPTGAHQVVRTVLNTGFLDVNATMDVTLASGIELSDVGTYRLRAFAKAAGESTGTTSNDSATVVNKIITAPVALSLPVVTFETFDGSNLSTITNGLYTEASGQTPSGSTSNWLSYNQPTLFGGKTAKVNLYSSTRREWIIGPKVTPDANTFVRFRTAITNYNSTSADADGMTGTDDSLNVMVSTNCGLSWQRLASITAADNLGFAVQTKQYSLAAYAGQNIMVALFATDGTISNNNDYDLHIDDLEIYISLDLDLASTVIVSPKALGCGGENLTAVVQIKNLGGVTRNFSNDVVGLAITSPSGVHSVLQTTLNEGALAIGQTLDVTVSDGLNLTEVGTYRLRGFVKANGEPTTVSGNDSSVVLNKVIVAPVALPLPVLTFETFDGENLNTVTNGLYTEATGQTTPTGTTSNWISSTQTALFGGKTAKVNLFSTSHRDWIVGPKVIATPTSAIRFNTAITNFASTSADADNMTGTDDSLKVMISTNCGFSWQTLANITAADNLGFAVQTKQYSLAAYAGQEVIVALLATDGTVDNANDYDLHIDDLEIFIQEANDLKAVAVIAPTKPNGCDFSATEKVKITVQNIGTVAQSSFNAGFMMSWTVNGQTAGSVSANETFNKSLAVGQIDTIEFAMPVDLTATAVYSITAYTDLATETLTHANDTIKGYTINHFGSVTTLPYVEEFTNTLPNGWSSQMLTTGTGSGTSTGNWSFVSSMTNPSISPVSGSIAYFNSYSFSKGLEARLATPCFALPSVAANDTLRLVFAMSQDSSYNDRTDSLSVRVSTNAGQSYSEAPILAVRRYVPHILPRWSIFSIDLAAYQGQNVRFAFDAYSGYGNNIGLDYVKVEHIAVVGTKPNTGLAKAIEVYPNPSSGLFTVDLSQITGEASVSVTNLQGKKVWTGYATETVSTIDLSNLATGSYLLQINTNKGLAVKRIIVQH
ncbi:Por secretion system C-terminal sorting domain-containing protein [Flexibacter flexilis DSM 6793]|uniref:Por secretion system C-terminal sorting domain-containing protein n=1 Tax=Flexibacter flexilis DSM 6793 TaxID=927664 RepID=A0A1I1LJX4_9BACT|nr:choice-of-anchor J domain-containing protein [Flexibacter flexilis]SFC73256.1 Por secretion system C-terminal sorting domain-containing protein [Flexibacter flexilis DSM 6793]